MAEGLVKGIKIYRDERGIPTQGVPEKLTVAELEALTAPTGPIQAPVNTLAPVLTGTPQVGQVLSVSDGNWNANPAPTFARVWKRNGSAISGQTAATYTLVTGDLAANITVEVTATNAQGVSAATSNSLGPVIAE